MFTVKTNEFLFDFVLYSAGLAAKRRLSSSSKLANAALKSGGKQYKVVCYYTNWSQYRPKTGKFTPEDIEPHLCTHIIFAFGWLKKGKLATFEENDDSKPGKKGLYEKITDLKLKNTDMKVLLAIGTFVRLQLCGIVYKKFAGHI